LHRLQAGAEWFKPSPEQIAILHQIIVETEDDEQDA